MSISEKTISEYLGDQRTKKFGYLQDLLELREPIPLSFKPDSSRMGEYSVVAKTEEGTESFRMFFSGGMTVGEAAQAFENYLNTDKPKKEYKVVLSAPKERIEKPKTQVDEWKTRLRSYKKQRFKTRIAEIMIPVLKARIAADPDKWELGDGVRYPVRAGGREIQWNRGFAISQIDPVNKMTLLQQVADTGLTVTGGAYDVIEDIWIPLGDLKRDRKYDVEAFAGLGENPKTLTGYHLGDFIEFFEDEARVVSKVAGITLSKTLPRYGSIPIAGFPAHVLSTFRPIFKKAGYGLSVKKGWPESMLKKER